MKSRLQAFTLVEVLVALAVAGILLSFIVPLLVSSNKGTTRINNYTMVLRELLISGNIVADDVHRALFIYPPDVDITLSSSSAPETVTVNGSNVWRTSNNGAFIAMILPADVSSTCTALSKYEFVAYYLIPRSNLTSLAASNWNNPGPDPENDDKQVLMRYSACTSAANFSSSAPQPTALADSEGKLVHDYLSSVQITISSALNQATIALVGARSYSGHTVTVPSPSSTDEVKITAYSRNAKN